MRTVPERAETTPHTKGAERHAHSAVLDAQNPMQASYHPPRCYLLAPCNAAAARGRGADSPERRSTRARSPTMPPLSILTHKQSPHGRLGPQYHTTTAAPGGPQPTAASPLQKPRSEPIRFSSNPLLLARHIAAPRTSPSLFSLNSRSLRWHRKHGIAVAAL